MALLKAPSKKPKTATLQVRMEEEVRLKLENYAEFIDASPSYVMSEALKLLFKKDQEFKTWLNECGHSEDQLHRDVGTLRQATQELPRGSVGEASQSVGLRSAQ